MKVVPKISSRAFRLAEAHHLGKPLKEYREGWDWKPIFQGMGMGLVLVLLAGLIIFLPFTSFSGDFPSLCFTDQCIAYANYDFFDLLMSIFFGGCGVFGLIMIVLALCLLFSPLVMGDLRVVLCSKGLIAIKSRTVFFDHWAATEMRHFYIVSRDDKTREKRIDASSNPFFLCRLQTSREFIRLTGEAGSLVEQEHVSAVLPEALKQYDANKSLDFGWLSLDREGIHLDETVQLPKPMPKLVSFIEKILPKSRSALAGRCLSTGERILSWNALEAFWLDSDHNALLLSDGADQPWACVPLLEIRNLEVCLWALEYARHLHRDGSEVSSSSLSALENDPL